MGLNKFFSLPIVESSSLIKISWSFFLIIVEKSGRIFISFLLLLLSLFTIPIKEDVEKFAWLIPFALTIIPGFLALYFGFLAISFKFLVKKFSLKFDFQKILIFL